MVEGAVPLSTGQMFDRYRVDALLGEGGMGRVFLAFDTKLHRNVALKVLLSPGDDDPVTAEAEARMLREARAAAALNHPNVVAIHDVGEAEGCQFLAMEFISGSTLRAIIARRNVSLEQRIAWLTDVARTLAAAHAVGLVHRDVKPENVMIRDDGVVKVLDFGIARRARIAFDNSAETRKRHAPLSSPPSSADLPTLTKQGAILGTPAYMSPEQIRGDELDGRADQFSWGVVAYELITGRSPWPTGKDSIAFIAAVLTDSPPPISEFEPDIDPVFERVVERAMQKGPANRFGSMDALVAAIEGESVSALVPQGSGSSRTSSGRSGRGNSTGASDRNFDRNSGQFVDSPPTLPSSSNRLGTPIGDAIAGRSSGKIRGVEASSSKGAADRSGPVRASSSSGRVIQIPSPAHGSDRKITTGEREALGDAPTIPPPPPDPSHRHHESGAKGWMPTVLAAIAAIAAVCAAILTGLQATGVLTANGTRQENTGAQHSGNLLAPSASSNTQRASATPTSLVNLPLPTGCSAAALAEYRAGIQALHDATWEAAHSRFEKAVQVDAACPEAHLRLVVTGHWFHSLSRQREVFQRAQQLRMQLNERDRLLLASYEPAIVREPAETSEIAQRLLQAIEKYPADAELRLLFAMRPEQPVEMRLEHGNRAVAIDPSYADALQIVARLQVALGRPEEALASLETCLKVAPAAADCRLDRTLSFRHQGRCADMAAEARRWSASDPGSALAYELLAGALASQNAPREAVQESLRQRWARLPDAIRAVKRKHDEARLAVLYGDFDEAQKIAEELEKSIEQDPNLETHLRPAMISFESLIETNQRTKAANLASAFLRRKDVWIAGAPHELRESGAWYFEPRMLGIMRRESKIQADEMARALVTAASRPYWDRPADDVRRWVLASAIDVHSQQEAVGAVKALSVPPSKLIPTSDFDRDRFTIEVGAPFAGQTFMLAGDYDNALPLLRPATALCGALDSPFIHTRAYLALGEALERKNDRAAACAAYKVVIDRWGKAKPKSITADEAKKRMQAISCTGQ